MIDFILKRSGFLKKVFSNIKKEVQINKSDLDKNLIELERRLIDKIDTILLEALKNKQMVISPNKSKSKTSLRQVQENKVIQEFRRTKKQIAKEKIIELQKNTPIPTIKRKLMQELGISKASFYNYLKELNNEMKVQIVQKSK